MKRGCMNDGISYFLTTNIYAVGSLRVSVEFFEHQSDHIHNYAFLFGGGFFFFFFSFFVCH